MYINDEKKRDFLYFEKQLNRLQSISTYVDLNKKRYDQTISSKEIKCIYSFWFKNNDKIMKSLKRNLKLSGPGKTPEHIIWDWNLDEPEICLYIGKTQNLKKRLAQHLLLKTDNLYKMNSDKLNKQTTACQFRAGFDYLYQDKKIDIINEISKRILISHIPIDKFETRFYLEDYLIGFF